MSEAKRYKFYNQITEVEDARLQLIEGFSQQQRSISPKFFYDEKGSELFTAITRTTEYYPTRTEVALLKAHGAEMARLIGPDATLLEYGSGSSEKIRTLLEILRPNQYVPMDISHDYLATSAETLATDYPWLNVVATCVDYSKDFDLPEAFSGNIAAFFPGSSIGNFSPQAALQFMIQVKKHVGADGGLLIGVDLKKDHDVLNAAYNDAGGLTAEFNLNVLSHINEAYGGNFERSQFEHKAFYNEALGCIQMFIVSKADQLVTIAGQTYSLKKGEEIHTENSYKYSESEFRALCQGAGFKHDHFWTDANGWFGVFYVA